MSKQQQPKEYIITEDELNKLSNTHETSARFLISIKNQVRSRPHPAPAQDEMEQRFQTKRQAWEQGYQHGGSAVQHDLNLIQHEAACKAREGVLKIIDRGISALDQITVDGYIPLGERGKRDVLVWLRKEVQKESLRHSTQEPPR